MKQVFLSSGNRLVDHEGLAFCNIVAADGTEWVDLRKLDGIFFDEEGSWYFDGFLLGFFFDGEGARMEETELFVFFVDVSSIAGCLKIHLILLLQF